MKAWKKRISLMLAVCAAIALLCSPTMAVKTVVSSQSVKVDGKLVTVQPYSISGNNYFKLRDVAALLSGTGSQFSISFNSQKYQVYITTGSAYKKTGGELQASGTSYTSCQTSAWTAYVNNKPINCNIYIIGGNNYFKLRDLGSAVGFGVDYDSAANTVLITTGNSKPWTPDISFTTTDSAGATWTDTCFKNSKITMINHWAYWCGPCVNELPDLQKLSANYAKKGLQVLGLYDGSSSSAEKSNKEAMKTAGITYPCLHYTAAFDEYLSTGYMPTTVFVDSTGKVVGEAYIGARGYNDWVTIVDGMLK